MRVTRRSALAAAVLLALSASAALAQDMKKEFERYQKMVADSSPAELFEIQGESLWKQKQGPRNASLEKCDLGQGPGVLKGAHAKLPRYFKDADRVMDTESRLLYCMETLQGRDRKEALQRPFGSTDKASEMETLMSYVAAQSRGHKLAPGMSHPREREAYEVGKKLFTVRTGLWDFSCASCHGEKGKRIRASELPELSDPKETGPLIATWPAYRVSTSKMITMQWRMNNCFQQMRTPEPGFGSDTVNALITFLTVTAKGTTHHGIGIKR